MALKPPPPDLMVREPVPADDPARISLKQSLQDIDMVWFSSFLLICVSLLKEQLSYWVAPWMTSLTHILFPKVLRVHMSSLAIIGLILFFLQVLWRIRCLELMHDHPESDYKWRKFWMKLYCFDNPEDPMQRLAIRAIGSMEMKFSRTS